MAHQELRLRPSAATVAAADAVSRKLIADRWGAVLLADIVGRKNVFTTEDAGGRRETPSLWAFRAFSLPTSAYSVVETFFWSNQQLTGNIRNCSLSPGNSSQTHLKFWKKNSFRCDTSLQYILDKPSV